ncbi:hypothetical protein ACFX2H_039227 [Malus domestica]
MIRNCVNNKSPFLSFENPAALRLLIRDPEIGRAPPFSEFSFVSDHSLCRLLSHGLAPSQGFSQTPAAFVILDFSNRQENILLISQQPCDHFSPTSVGLLNEYFPDVCLAIWTTTPWTIPANAAVAVNTKLLYAIIEVQSLSEDSLSDGNKKGRSGNLLKEEKKLFLIVASDLVPTLESKRGVKLVVRKKVSGSDLENCRYVHPHHFRHHGGMARLHRFRSHPGQHSTHHDSQCHPVGAGPRHQHRWFHRRNHDQDGGPIRATHGSARAASASHRHFI